MSEGAFYEDGQLVEPGETRCVRWPLTCGEVQREAPTVFHPCDFCLYGPPEPPARSGDGLSLAEARERIEETERTRGEQLRGSVIAVATQPTVEEN